MRGRGREVGKRRPARALAAVVTAVALLGCDPTSLYGPLRGQWTYQTGGMIAAKPAISGTAVYLGSWDGNEYALDATSGGLLWKSFLGLTNANCFGQPATAGVTSSPLIQNGVAYLGGGASTWDALDTSTGSILWSVYTGDSSAAGGHYNWSSPAEYNGYAYVGIASYCDSPLVQGELLQVNLATEQVQNVFKVVPDGQVGGSIWTSPVVDPSTGTVFIDTGNADPNNPNQPYAQSVIALDATTLTIKGWWRLPASQATEDSDFGTTPVLFTDSGGRPLLAVTNKNGFVYAFDRSNISAGPVWQVQISTPAGYCPCTGSFSTGVFDGTNLYYAAGVTSIGGTSVWGSVRAIDPNTGGFVWQDAIPSQIYGALAEANGMIVVPASGGGLYVVRSSDGAVAFANGLTSNSQPAIYAPPAIANGSLFIGTTDGVLHVFAFPSSATAPSGLAHAATRTCTAARRGGVTASCRILISHRSQCVRIGELPDAVGSIALERIAVRSLGAKAASHTRLRLYLNASCAGAARFVITISPGGGARRFSRPPILAPGTVVSVAASRPVALMLRAVGSPVTLGRQPLSGPLAGIGTR